MIVATDMTFGMVNFSEVAPGIYRSGQPFSESWHYLKTVGVKRVIKLNPDSEGDDSAALDFGMELCKCPISTMQQVLTEPDVQNLYLAVQLIQPGTLVHCSHGQDRTGLIIGLWRRQQGVSKDDAYAEMKQHGFHWELFGLGKAWEDYA